jgi:GNAT superfamily N-acetyltransferase
MEIQVAQSDDDILKCIAVLRELRPHLDKADMLPIIKELMEEGYVLAFIEEDNLAVAAIGFRYLQLLYNGKQFYIDDLSTLPAYRGKGYAGQLLEYVIDLARKNGFNAVTLDSGHQRFDAHRLYLNKEFTISAHHFSKTL